MYLKAVKLVAPEWQRKEPPCPQRNRQRRNHVTPETGKGGTHMSTDQHNEISAAIEGLRSRLETLASITADTIFVPGRPQERYHAIVEEAYVVLGLIETHIDELRAELEYQHKRLDDIRDAQLASTSQEKELSIDAAETSRRAHEDWANDE
jgi:hypothetical protein